MSTFVTDMPLRGGIHGGLGAEPPDVNSHLKWTLASAPLILSNMIISLCRTHLLRRHIPNDLTVRCRRIVAVVAAEVDAKFTLLQNSHHIIQQTRCFASEDIQIQLAYELIVDGKVIPQSKVSIQHGSGGAKIEEDGKEVVVFLHGLLGNAKVCRYPFCISYLATFEQLYITYQHIKLILFHLYPHLLESTHTSEEINQALTPLQCIIT